MPGTVSGSPSLPLGYLASMILAPWDWWETVRLVHDGRSVLDALAYAIEVIRSALVLQVPSDLTSLISADPQPPLEVPDLQLDHPTSKPPRMTRIAAPP